MPRHIACLTFDFDAMTGFTARGQMSPTPVSRGEFGAIGAQRLVDLLANLVAVRKRTEDGALQRRLNLVHRPEERRHDR